MEICYKESCKVSSVLPSLIVDETGLQLPIYQKKPTKKLGGNRGNITRLFPCICCLFVYLISPFTPNLRWWNKRGNSPPSPSSSQRTNIDGGLVKAKHQVQAEHICVSCALCVIVRRVTIVYWRIRCGYTIYISTLEFVLLRDFWNSDYFKTKSKICPLHLVKFFI